MKVLVISGAFPPMRLGEATNALHLCQHLADHSVDVHVLTSHSNTAVDDPRIKIYPIMHRWSWAETDHFRRFVKRSVPDAILLMYIGGLIYNYHPMITFAPTLTKGLLPHVPFVTRFESVFPTSAPIQPSPLTRIARKGVVLWAGREDVDHKFGTLLRDSDRVVVLCELHRALLSKCFSGLDKKSVLIPPAPNVSIVPENNGISRRQGREMLAVRPDEFIVTYMGYIYPKKGIETLLEAFQIVRSKKDNVRLVMIGGSVDSKIPHSLSYFNQIHTLARELKIDDKIIWTGEYAWNDKEISFYLYAADVCVLPFNAGVHLNNSSFSSVVAHSLPVITTQGTVVDQPLIHKQNVLLCPPKTPEAMADAIILLMENSNLRRQLQTGARSLAQEWFSWEKAIDRTMAALTQPCVKT
jgi:glycosyltransferase involved in cell wall biosynthesis